MGKVPKVMSLKEVLLEWLDHRREVLVRRSKLPAGAIDRRLEILGGYLIAYLNIDEVIRIIREEDEPKPVMMERWSLTDTQAEAILNMRLRALRKLEEFEIRTEFDALSKEKADRNAAGVRREAVADRCLGNRRGPQEVRSGDRARPRRTMFADAPEPI
jgi:topoisomerase-4 subunit A